MKYIVFYIIFAFSTVGLVSQNWFDLQKSNLLREEIGYSTYDQSISVKIDKYGNSYYTGYFEGILVLGTDTLVGYGNRDIFVAKYNKSGGWDWAVSAGGIQSDYGKEICINDNGEVFVTGYLSDRVFFDTIELNSTSNTEIFVAKIDTSGKWKWAKLINQGGYDRANSITCDKNYCYLVGNFENTIIADSLSLTSIGSKDLFVAKISFDGDWIWAKSGGSINSDDSYSVTFDSLTNAIILCGYFSSQAIFGNITLNSSGSRDLLLAKLDTAGNWIWAQKAGSSASEEASSVITDKDGFIYSTGFYSKSFSVDSITLQTPQERDIWIAKLTDTGNWVWIKSANGSGADNVYNITADIERNIYISGGFEQNLNFDSHSISAQSSRNGYWAKINSQGIWQKANLIEGTNTVDCFGISIGKQKEIHLTGNFYDKIIFANDTSTSRGDSDIFSAILDSNGNLIDYNIAFGTRNIIVLNDSEIDRVGDLVLVGYFYGSVAFGKDTLIANGLKDGFIAKYNLENGFMWARNIGGKEIDDVTSLAIDSVNNIFFGAFSSSDFVFNSTNIVNKGFCDIIYGRLDPLGNLQWIKSIGDTQDDICKTVAVAPNGDYIISGNFLGSPNFGNVKLSSATFEDVFVAKLDVNGDIIWAKKAGGDDYDEVKKLVVSNDGSIYIAGSFEDAATVGSYSLISKGGDDGFIAKISSNGNWLWAKSFGTTFYQEYANSIALDNSGNLFVAGTFRALMNIDSNFVLAFGENDIFVSKMTSNGNWVWLKSFGSNKIDLPSTISFKDNSIYLCGKYSAAIRFDSQQLLTSGSANSFLNKLDTNGNTIKAQSDLGKLISNAHKYHFINSNVQILTGNFVGEYKIKDLNLSEKYPIDNNFYLAFYGIEPLSRKWSFISNTGTSAIIKLPESINPTINNRKIKIGDGVGVFYIRNSNYYCAGYGLWNNQDLNITVWGDNLSTLVKDGISLNEKYTLFAWDSESGKEFLTDVRFSHGTDNFHIDTVSVISKFPYYYDTLRINLLAGWNLTSTYIAPLNLSMSSIFSEIGSDIVIVKNSSGQVYIPLYNINTIGNWNISQGYQIYANKNTTLKIIGETVNPKLIEISLNAGWNLISYLRNTPMNPATALEYLFQNSRLVIVKNSAGQVYIPSYNINTIGNLLPSFGYQLYLTSPDTLIYPGN